MNFRNAARSAGIARILALLCLTIALGACTEDNPAAPTTTVTVGVNVTPDSTIFAWNLAGPDSFTLSGSGDTVLVDMPAGEYKISWEAVKYYATPYPVSRTLSAGGGNTITFAGTYERRSSERLEILFLGSSYFGSNMMVGTIRSMATAMGINMLTEARIPSGMYLSYHATNAQSISMINSRYWDYVILQGVGSIVAYPEDAHFDLIATLRSLENTIHNNRSSTKILFCMPWAFEDGMTWTPDGKDDYFDMQQLIYDNTLTFPDSVDISIAPVGWAWNSILLEGPPQHYLHMFDWNHPSPKGSYLMACVILASIYGEPVVDNPHLGGLPASEAAHFQETATSIVMENLELWHLR
jgi:hypothetical protein